MSVQVMLLSWLTPLKSKYLGHDFECHTLQVSGPLGEVTIMVDACRQAVISVNFFKNLLIIGHEDERRSKLRSSKI